MCCRLFRFILCFVLAASVCCLPFTCAAVAEDPVDPAMDFVDSTLTLQKVCELAGVDPDNEVETDVFFTWLYSLPQMGLERFSQEYLDAGYALAGLDSIYFSYCVLNEYEPETLTVVKNDGYTQYRGEDVQLTYFSKTIEGYPAGSWWLGTTGKTGTGGYFGQPFLFNLTDINSKVQNVLTDANLEKLEKTTEKIYQYLYDYMPRASVLQLISNYLISQPFRINRHFVSAEGVISSSPYQASGRLENFSVQLEVISQNLANGFSGTMSRLNSYLNGSWNYGYLQVPSQLGDIPLHSSAASGNGLIDLLAEVGRSVNFNLAELGLITQQMTMGNSTQELTAYTYDGAGNLVETPSDEKSSLAAILVQGYENLQRDTAALRYVLANDDDIRLKAENKPMQDAVEDNFTGSGGGAASVDDIKDASGITSGMKDLLDENPVSVDDFFKTASDGQNYNFFSQSTADSLDTVQSPSVVSASEDYQSIYDDWLEDYTFDENGFVVPDMSGFSISAYLQGVS